MGNVKNFLSENQKERIRKNRLEEMAKRFDIPLPSKQSQRDTFDLETGKRVNPEL